MTDAVVLYEASEKIGVITLNRPDSRSGRRQDEVKAERAIQFLISPEHIGASPSRFIPRQG